MGEGHRRGRGEQPALTDGTIRLRPFTAADARAVQREVQDPEIPRFMGIPPRQTLEGVERWLATLPASWRSGTAASFVIVAARGGTVLGSIGYHRSADDAEVGEVGYWVAAGERGKGYATRAVLLLTPWIFTDAGLYRLEITTHPENLPSQRVAERAGFRREGVLRGYREHAGRRVDLVMYARLATDTV